VIEDWYERLQADGLLDVLAPYQPAVVGAYPLAVAGPETPLEVVCRAVDLPAFARMMERTYGHHPGFALHGGELDGEDAVFAEFQLDGLPLEVSAQREHVHRRLGAATLGLHRVLSESDELARTRLAAAVERDEDWLEAALLQLNLSRVAVESLASADPPLVRRVMGLPQPRIPLAGYVLPLIVGVSADLLIVAAGAARGSQQYTGLMLLVEAAVLGLLFGARMGLVASLAPLVPVGAWLVAPVLVGQGSCGPDCGQTLAGYVYVPALVASAAGLAGLLRDRYRPRPG
jgi:Domain of unknown function (DUF4269)